MQECIHKNQSGFLLEKQLKNNVNSVLDILEYFEQDNEKQASLILDAEEAFDNVNPAFLFTALEGINFEENL